METTAIQGTNRSDQQGRKVHSNSSNLIQVIGAVAIVAFHTSAPGSQIGWMAVELFFVTAGMNMSSALKRETSVSSYAWARAKRLLPEVSAIWLIVIAAIIAGKGTSGMNWFAATSPFFLQNLTPPFFDYDLPKDAVFGPLWFLGALVQLQLIVFLSRKFLDRSRPFPIIVFTFALAFILRLAFSLISGHHLRSLSVGDSESLYCMPFCHAEALVLGVLLARGALPTLGRWLPIFLIAAAAAGVASLWLSAGKMAHSTLGYEFPLRANASHLWGYPLLALVAASLCARDGFLTKIADARNFPKALAAIIAAIAPLTFGIYVFHGLIIATGLNGASSLAHLPASISNSLVFIITLAEAALLSFAFLKVRRWMPGGGSTVQSKPK